MIVNIKDVRRKNLALLIEQEGGTSALAAKIVANPSYISQIMSPKSRGEVGERFARKIEEALKLEPGWIDTDHSEGATAGAPLAQDKDVMLLASGAKYLPEAIRPRVETSKGLSLRGFAYQLLDTAMEPRIPSGAMLIVEPESEARSGHICVIAGNAGVFVREISRNPDGSLLLKAANPQYPTVTSTQDMQVVGVVRQAIKDFD